MRARSPALTRCRLSASIRQTRSAASRWRFGDSPTCRESAGPMIWPLVVYFLMSLIIGISAGIRAGLSPAACAILTSALALVAGGGLRASVLWGDRTQKIGGPLI